MANENLTLENQELQALKGEFPAEMDVIIEMLEAAEEHFGEEQNPLN